MQNENTQPTNVEISVAVDEVFMSFAAHSDHRDKPFAAAPEKPDQFATRESRTFDAGAMGV